MAVYAIGDIHGCSYALNECLNKCKFNNKTDTLIILGDIVDGGRKTKDVIDRILKIKNKILILGNHDEWCLNWMKTGDELPGWWHQGGYATSESYGHDYENVPSSHVKLLESSVPYYIDEQNRIYVHGGFNPNLPIETQHVDDITWDRELMCQYAVLHEIPKYKHVFVGHTTTQLFDKRTDPLTMHNLTALDTGCGWDGKLTIMNVDTFEYWQSDINAHTQTQLMVAEEFTKQKYF